MHACMREPPGHACVIPMRARASQGLEDLVTRICCALVHASLPTHSHSLSHSLRSSLSSKVVSQYSSLLAPMAVDAVLKVIDPARPHM